jgi:hypothetical protein
MARCLSLHDERLSMRHKRHIFEIVGNEGKIKELRTKEGGRTRSAIIAAVPLK